MGHPGVSLPGRRVSGLGFQEFRGPGTGVEGVGVRQAACLGLWIHYEDSARKEDGYVQVDMMVLSNPVKAILIITQL